MGVMLYILSCFVLSVSCGVLEKHVTKYEGETVELSCFTDINVRVEWGIRSIFQRHQQRTPKGRDEYRRIYTIFGMQKGFNLTRRYSVREGNGYYNLTIENLNITENGEYVCYEDGGQGRKSSTQLSVYINVSLLLTNRSLVGVVGNIVTLPCSRHADGPVRWLYVQSERSLQDVISKDNVIQSKYWDTATVVQTTKDYNLSLHNVQLNQSGFYICIEDGLLFFKTPVRLMVLVNVSTLESSEESTVYSGDRVTLPCRPSFNGTVRWSYTRSHEPPLNVIFVQNAIDSKYMNRVTVNDDHSSRDYNLSFNAVQLNDYGWYICHIGYDDSSTFIHAVLLTVKVDVFRYRKVQRLSLFAGDNVTLPCQTNFTDLQRWLYISSHNASQDVIASGQLTFSSRVQLNDISQTSQDYNLTLLDVQLNQTGWYICVGVDNNDDTTEHPFFLTVNVPVKPNITEHPPNKVTFKSGIPVTFKCRAIGSVELVYSWKYNGTALSDDPGRGVNVLPDCLLELTKPSIGTYQCFVSNRFGEAMCAESLVIPEPEDSKAALHSLAALISIGVTAVLIVGAIAIFIVFYCIRKKRLREDKSSGAVVQHEPTSSQVQRPEQTTAKSNAEASQFRVIPSKGRGGVVGVTVCNKKLFVLRRESEQKIEQYNVETFEELASIPVKKLSDSNNSGKSLTSCNVNNCLYLNDDLSVFRVDLSTSKVHSWRVKGSPIGLSVNRTSNVLVTCYGNKKIKEYSSRGSIKRSIELKMDRFMRPYHCVELTDCRYVVSQEHSVSLVGKGGALIKTYGNNETSELKMDEPRCIVVTNESVLVTDMNNDRILLFNSSLSNARLLTLPVNTQLELPSCMYLDQSSGRLFVGEWSRAGRVLVFDNIDFSY